MMTTADAVRAGTPAADPRRAMVALARVEAVRLLRHPVPVAGVLLLLAAQVYGWVTGANRYPILQDEDRSIQFIALLVLGGAALVGVNLAALRSRRHATVPLFDTLVLPEPWRTGAFLLSVLPFAAVTAVLVGVRIGVLAALPGAAGRPDPFELALYPAVVVLLGAAGVLLARLARTVIAAPLLLLGLAVLTEAVAVGSFPGGARVGWLLPVALTEQPMPLPVGLLARPAGWHLAYVTGLTVLVATAALAVARAGDRRGLASGSETRSSGARWLLGAGTAGVTLAVLAGSAQFLPLSDGVRAARATATERPGEVQTCRQIGQVTYCAFGDFASWIGGWDTVVRGVLRGLPDEQARQPLVVRQRVITASLLVDGRVVSLQEQAADVAAWRKVDADAGTPNAVTVGTRWGDPRSEVALAGMVAHEIVVRASTAGDRRTGQGHTELLCGARGVLAAWLAGQATPRTAEGLHEVHATSWGSVPFGDPEFPVGMDVPDREMTLVLSLLRRPAGDVAEVVRRSWAELAAPSTSTERAGELLGVPVPPLPADPEERVVCEG